MYSRYNVYIRSSQPLMESIMQKIEFLPSERRRNVSRRIPQAFHYLNNKVYTIYTGIPLINGPNSRYLLIKMNSPVSRKKPLYRLYKRYYIFFLTAAGNPKDNPLRYSASLIGRCIINKLVFMDLVS